MEPPEPQEPKPKVIGKYAATQSVAELGIGSVLHAMGVPWAGHLLSLNQGVILTFALRNCQDRRQAIGTSAGIASVASVLKSLAPVGKKLTPMLAICIQGWLYALGPAAMGLNFVGVALGMFLLSMWGFLQPVLMAYVFFGETLFIGAQKIWLELARLTGIGPELGIWILGGAVALKCLIAAGVGIWIWKSGPAIEARYHAKVLTLPRMRKEQSSQSSLSPVVGALKDLINFWFILGLILSAGFLFLSGGAEVARVWIYVLRVVAVAWLFFWLLRVIPAEWVARGIKRFPQIKAALAHLDSESTPPRH